MKDVEVQLAAVDISDEGVEQSPSVTGDAVADEAALKAEANRKKREAKKAQKMAAKGTTAAGEEAAEEASPIDGTPKGRWDRGLLPGGRAERRSTGQNRGMGVFAKEAITKGEVVAAAPPALSVIFEPAAQIVCSFCFDQLPLKDMTSEHVVSLKTSEGSFGVVLDDLIPKGAEQPVAVVTRITATSANRAIVRVGDRLVAIRGAPIGGGQAAAVALLKAALEAGASEVEVTLARPAALRCHGCDRVAVCERCAGEGRMQWHNAECAVFQQLPEAATKGRDTSTLRMLLRHKVTTHPSVGDWCATKEPAELLGSLQANPCDVPPAQLDALSKMTGNSLATTMNIIGQIRTNACHIIRGNAKVGCALSVLMGWHNHDCSPNAASVIGPSGEVSISALKDIAEGEEVTISYVDVRDECATRKKTLLQHYGFDCKCARCTEELRQELKQRMKEANAYRAGQRR